MSHETLGTATINDRLITFNVRTPGPANHSEPPEHPADGLLHTGIMELHRARNRAAFGNSGGGNGDYELAMTRDWLRKSAVHDTPTSQQEHVYYAIEEDPENYVVNEEGPAFSVHSLVGYLRLSVLRERPFRPVFRDQRRLLPRNRLTVTDFDTRRDYPMQPRFDLADHPKSVGEDKISTPRAGEQLMRALFAVAVQHHPYAEQHPDTRIHANVPSRLSDKLSFLGSLHFELEGTSQQKLPPYARPGGHDPAHPMRWRYKIPVDTMRYAHGGIDHMMRFTGLDHAIPKRPE